MSGDAYEFGLQNNRFADSFVKFSTMTTFVNVREDDWQLQLSSEYPGFQLWVHERSGVTFWRKSTPFDNTEKVAIIVPFRDLQAEQKRTEQLNRFHPEMTAFLKKGEVPFKIFIIEQSNDGRKFNRGKLLNVGFEIARSQGYNVFVLHDVDLIPSEGLLPFYVRPPSAPVHVARVWNRYSGNLNYFGGIVTYTTEQYEAINGYPNNYWGTLRCAPCFIVGGFRVC